MPDQVQNAVELRGRSLVAGVATQDGGETFQGYNPADGKALDPLYYSATLDEVDHAAGVAFAAAPKLASISAKERSSFLRRIADLLDHAAPALIERAMLETALPQGRLIGEVARTSNQLRLFAKVVEEGSWVMARIDTADPARTPVPKPDIRSMLRPLGPVAVFGASNFPLAFSVAGGDTASALAAGNPVIVKAHPAHPGTSELAGQVIADAVRASGLPPGTFSLLFDAGHAIGSALVQHPQIRAVGFTGSFRGGRALMDLAAKRSEPIPVYAEMGSTNPVFVLPGTLRERGEEVAGFLHSSFTMNGGQFCTKPGLVFVEEKAGADFSAKLREIVAKGPAFSLLTGGMAKVYNERLAERQALQTAIGAAPDFGFGVQTTLLETGFDAFTAEHSLAEEIFGPTTLLIQCNNSAEMLEAANGLDGHLTATILGTNQDLRENTELLRVLETKVGRVIFNRFPTGVEVCHAMVHGGPYPATSDGRSTSVGSQAIFRFTRPVCYQGFPSFALPPALQDDNPEGILRLRDGVWEGFAG
jgi:NADP-dependent aldehyde dehydrogenase